MSERIDDLQRDGLKIIRDDERFAYGQDAVLLSDFVRAKKGEKLVDLGTGTGILPILIHAKTGADFLAVDIDAIMCDMARRSVEMNGLGEHIDVRWTDLRSMGGSECGAFDAAVCNPPYFVADVAPLCPERALATHEKECGVEDAVDAAARLLKNGGRFYICYPARLVPRLCAALEGRAMAVKRLCYVYTKENKPPYLVLAEARKGGGEGAEISFMKADAAMENETDNGLEPMLYLCATPIGNMEDMTPRSLRVLRDADEIYCEDTRRTGPMLARLGIKRKLHICHTHNEAKQAKAIVALIKDGHSAAFVSDAGMPGISDPGGRLVTECIAAGVPYTVVPGASAALTALVLSGMPVKNACFVGFLPREAGERRRALALVKAHPGVLIIYESPLRVAATAVELRECLGERPAVLARELTKLHEETVRGTLSEIANKYADEPPRGECVLVVAGVLETIAPAVPGGAEMLMAQLIESGASAKDAAWEVSALFDLPRREAYALALRMKETVQ